MEPKEQDAAARNKAGSDIPPAPSHIVPVDHPSADPGHHELRVKTCNIDEFVRIEDPEPSIMEFQDPILSQIP